MRTWRCAKALGSCGLRRSGETTRNRRGETWGLGSAGGMGSACGELARGIVNPQGNLPLAQGVRPSKKWLREHPTLLYSALP